ncbi:hypothetical protein H4R24_004251 [Coemansia sp. RSA 988]|nr:hypothetical protein H4R24_004251 [Coemansia sp. RSA 988]
MELHQTLLGHDGCVNALCWSSDGRYLFSGSDDATICVWRAVGDGALLCRFRTGFYERVFDLKVMPAPNGHLLVACSMDTTVKVFDVYKVLAEASSTKIVFSSLRQTVDTVLEGGCYCVRTFTAHTGPVKRAAIIPDSPYEFLSCSEDGTVRHFDIREHPSVSPAGHRRHSKEGRIVADYHDIGAEVHALDVNIFRPAIFAAGGSLSSIMVHDRRMASTGLPRNGKSCTTFTNWAGDRCVVRLRRDRADTNDYVFEALSDEMVTGLRFLQDEPGLVVGSWSYDFIYLFDLKQSTAYTDAVSPRFGLQVKGRERELASDEDTLPLKRMRADVVSSRQAVNRSGTTEVRSSVRSFARGLSHGIRMLSEDEAPYMYTSSSSSDIDPIESSAALSDNADNTKDCSPNDICRICNSAVHLRAAGFSSLFEEGWTCCDRSLAMSNTENVLTTESFEAFAANMAGGALQRGLASLSFALRSLNNQHINGYERMHHCKLRPCEGTPASEDVKQAMVALSGDPAFERLRIKSLLHNDRVCIYATMFRQRWVKRYNAYLSDADIFAYGSETIYAIGDDIRSLRSLLDSAMRDSIAALELNELNIPAHYNRLLIAWDSARLDVMQLILELAPLIGAQSAVQPTDSMADSDPTQNRLRADFGDVMHRLRELHQKLGAHRDTVHDEAQAIYVLQKILTSAALSEDANVVTIFLIHTNEKFFEMSADLVRILAHDASLLLDLFEQNSKPLVVEPLGGTNISSYLSALQELVMRWKTLSMELHDYDASMYDTENSLRSPFKGTLFHNYCEVAAEPHVYMWHRHLRSENGSDADIHAGLPGAGDFDLPLFPANGIYYPDPDDQLSVSIARTVSYDWEANRELTQQSETSLEHPPLQPHNRAVGSDVSMNGNATGNGSSPALQNSTGWPRETREFLPNTWNSIETNPSNYYKHQPDLESNSYVEANIHHPVPIVMPSRRYRGHCSFQTVKDVNTLFGNYIASGSDDGCLFIWDRTTMELVQIIRGDSEIVNIVEGHPTLPMIAVSGLDSEVQIFHIEQGGPAPIHRRNFPVVRQAQIVAANISDPAAREACVSMAYTIDPYSQDLEHAHHSPLPTHFDLRVFLDTIARPFPAVSKSKLAQIEQIVSSNEDMRLGGLSHTTLTHQILNGFLFNGFEGTDNYESSNYSNSEYNEDSIDGGGGSEDESTTSDVSSSM